MARKSELPPEFYTVDFKSLYKSGGSHQVRMRLLGLSHIQELKTTTEVASLLRVEARTVANWIRRYKLEGIAGLEDKDGRGLKSKFDINNENILRDKVLKMQEERKGGRVCGKDIQVMLENDFGVSYKLSAVYSLLKRAGLSWISSRSKHPKQNPETQELFKKLREHGCRCGTCGSLL